jgi:RNA polymerase sigma-70 factor (sigma-E family)
VRRQGAKDEEFLQFVSSSSDALFRSALLLSADHGHAEDLVQAALFSTYGAWPRIRDQHRRLAYARRCVLNEWLTWNRRHSNSELPVDPIPETTLTGEQEGLAEREGVLSALARLPPRQRAVVVLRYYEDLTEIQVARLLRCSIGTVKSQASAALAKLRVDPELGRQLDLSEPKEATR